MWSVLWPREEEEELEGEVVEEEEEEKPDDPTYRPLILDLPFWGCQYYFHWLGAWDLALAGWVHLTHFLMIFLESGTYLQTPCKPTWISQLVDIVCKSRDTLHNPW